MKSIWSRIRKMPFIVILVPSVLLFGLITFIVESLPCYDVRQFDFDKVSTIEIEDRGLLGNGIIEKRDRATVQFLSCLIKNSYRVDLLKTNLRANLGLCEMHIKFRDNKTKTILLTNTSYSDGIIQSGQYYYRNDSLLNVILKMLKK